MNHSNDKATGCCDYCKSWAFHGCTKKGNCPCHSPAPRTGKSWHVCEICQFELRPNAPFYGGHQKDCPRADSKVRCTYLYCHGASNGCIPDCSCKKNGHKPHILPDSEDDEIEEIIKGHSKRVGEEFRFNYQIESKWLRMEIRSYGDMREEKALKEQLPRTQKVFDEKKIEWKEEGRREATLEFSKISGGYEAGKRAALDELERRMPLKSDPRDGAYSSGYNNCLKDLRVIIADMRK